MSGFAGNKGASGRADGGTRGDGAETRVRMNGSALMGWIKALGREQAGDRPCSPMHNQIQTLFVWRSYIRLSGAGEMN